MSDSFVIDASAVLKLLVEEPGSEYARLFFQRLGDPDPVTLYAPDLLYVECANTMWKYVTRYHYPPQHAQATLHALARLAFQAVPTQLLFQDALRLSLRHHVSAYDASSLCLAERLRCTLVTEDANLIRRVRLHTKIKLQTLAEAVSRDATP